MADLDLAALRREALDGVEHNKTTVFGRHSDAPIGIGPAVVLSLLDRIEEQRHNRRLLEIIEEDQPHGLG